MAEITVSTSAARTAATRAAPPHPSSGQSVRGRPDLVRHSVRRVNPSELGTKFQDLGGEGLDVLARHQRVHLVEVVVAPNHVERVSSDGARRPQNGNYPHRSICYSTTRQPGARRDQMYSFS